MWLCLRCFTQIEPDDDLPCCPNCGDTTRTPLDLDDEPRQVSFATDEDTFVHVEIRPYEDDPDSVW